MTFTSKAYIAGIGVSPSPSGSQAKGSIASLVSAATKALLDAGVTYDDISRSVATSGHGVEASKVFHEGGVAFEGAKDGAEFDTAMQFVTDRGDGCVLMIAAEKSAAVALILVSESFLWSRAYLKDSSALVRESPAPSKGQNSKGLSDLCQIVWALRGWSSGRDAASKQENTKYTWKASKSFELSRADAKPIPEWKDVEFRQDGKHRLGYNPAAETRDISQEDYEAVRAIGKWQTRAGQSTQFKRKGGDRASLARL